ncbi:MAG TPA: AAA family ATPase [Chloroflexota bacterium]|nr:AAA family ATPase [Chloroflexota bacterium]
MADALALQSGDRQEFVAAAQSGAPASARTTPPARSLVGRAAELTAMSTAVEVALGGERQTVLLTGAAGVGKSRQAREIGLHARERGFVLATGRCFEAEQAVPYLPFRNVFLELYRAAPEDLRQALASRRPYLAPVLPDVVGGVGIQGSGDEQSRVLFAAAGFLSAVADHHPVALLLDDLHWADFASLRLLNYLAIHLGPCRLVIVATYLHDFVNAQHPLQDVLRDLRREITTHHLTVPPLDRSGTKALIASLLEGGAVSPDVSALIHEHTGGNPFFVEQMVRTLAERGKLRQFEGTWVWEGSDEIEVPQTVRAVIGQRVRRLPPTARDVLTEASVLGQTFRVDDLSRMTTRVEHDLEDGLDAAESLGLIRETDRGWYEFDHTLMRQALYYEIPSRRRRRLHRRAAAAIAALPESRRVQRASDLAYHSLEGDRPAEAIPYALMAGDQAEAVFGHAEAEQQYRLALRLAEEVDDAGATALACTGLAAPLHRTSRFAEALDLLERAAAIYRRADDLDALVIVMGGIAAVHSDRGSAEEGLERIAPFLPRFLSQPSSPALIHLLVSYGSLLFVVGRRNEHLRMAQRAVELADALGDAAPRAVAEAQLGLALLSLRRREEARHALDRAIVLAEEGGDLVTLALALNNAAFLTEVWGEFVQSRHLSKRAYELAQRLGDPSQSAFMATALGRSHFYSGEWSESENWHERAQEMARTVTNSWVAPYLPLGYGQLLLAQGKEEAAELALARGLALAEDHDDVQAQELAWQLLGELDLQRGMPERAWERFSSHGVTEAWDPERDSLSLPAAIVLARTLMALDRGREAARVVANILEQARAAGERLVLAEALALHAMLAAQSPALDEAEEAFDEAITLAQTIGYPYLEARIRYACGTTLLRRRDQELPAALAIFQHLGGRIC